jgi:hypothetical protein
MSLPDGVTVKLEIYTLACRELLIRLRDLQSATQANTRLSSEACLHYCNDVLKRFFIRSSALDRYQAAEQFGNLLRAEVDLFRSLSSSSAAIFDDVIAAIQGKLGSWHYHDNFEQLHMQGRILAQSFFAASPLPETHDRLHRVCQLMIGYGASAENDRITMLAESFGYRLAPMAYYAQYWDNEGEQELMDVVFARFTFEHDFALYLAYAFLFLHEYTAHVYAADYSNERFNDGWMLHVAAVFLKREWNKTTDLGLDLDQVNIFYEYLYPRLNPIPRRACAFARDFDSWLSAQQPDRFMQITYELAAFQPRVREKDYWPTQFINALEHEFRTDRRRLLSKIENSRDIRQLMSTFTPV